MRDNKNIIKIALFVAFFVLITLDSFASTDHDESILIQKACGLSGAVCSDKSFESKQIQRFFSKVSRKMD